MLTFRQFIKESAAIAVAISKRDDPESYYYHITQGKNMDSIAKRGLSRKPGQRNYNFSKRKAVYLSDTPKSARAFARDISRKDDDPRSLRMIRIPKANIDPKKIHRDRNTEFGYRWSRRHPHPKPHEWEYHGDIPPESIEFSGGEHLKKNSKDWKKATNRSPF